MITAYDVFWCQLISSYTNKDFTGHSYSVNKYINDPGLETIELHDEVNPNESCVIIEPGELFALSRRTSKLRSFRVHSFPSSIYFHDTIIF